MDRYDVIVVGAGHAGIEAALAAARAKAKTLILTMNADQIGAMSCNPAIGGLGKSQLAREVDALGGAMCRIADKAAIQYRLLNEKKGPAVRATRVHVDRHEYRQLMKFLIESQSNLSMKQGQVTKLLFENGGLDGIETSIGQKFFAKQIVITTGTFMNGKAHVGKINYASGRAGEPPSVGLSDFLAAIGIRISRFKTGTVPRLDGRTIDFSKIEEQPTHIHCGPLSFFTKAMRTDLVSAHIAFTNQNTHEIIRKHLCESPLYTGIISSRGPRYCPSVEDKIVRFSDKEHHHIFLEIEGRFTHEVYAGGLSTSLPYDCQLEFLRTITGLEQVEIIRPGYAIEYDSIDSTQLYPTLEVKDIPGLYFAGQVNGTSGYEEAAAQGILAGINAAAQAKNMEPLVFKRAEAYIGVMVDDLVIKGTKEPYRMFTSRAEWRLLLRQDNADTRLLPIATKYGLLNDEELETIRVMSEKRKKLRQELENKRFAPTEKVNEKIYSLNQALLKDITSAAELLRRPGFTIGHLRILDFSCDGIEEKDASFVETEIKYEGYLKQAEAQIKHLNRLENMSLPTNLHYNLIAGLPREAVEKLSAVCPVTLGQASRISGITPATISIIALYLSKIKKNKEGEQASAKMILA